MFKNNLPNYQGQYPYFYPNTQYFYSQSYWPPQRFEVPYYQSFSISPPQNSEPRASQILQNQNFQAVKKKENGTESVSMENFAFGKSKDKETEKKSAETPVKGKRSKLRITNPDRNLESNCLKLFLKQMKQNGQRKESLVKKIIQSYHLSISPKEFTSILSQNFPNSLNYVKPRHFKEFCQIFEGPLKEFSLILRISCYHFFKFDIYLLNTRSIRTTREVREKQIKTGKSFLRSLQEI